MLEALQVSGKLPGRSSVAMAAGHNKNRLLFAWDHRSRRRFLVDTGAEVSVLPITRADKSAGHQGTKLTAANGSSIHTYGKRQSHYNSTDDVLNGPLPLPKYPSHCWGQTFSGPTQS